MKRQARDWEKTFAILTPDKKNLHLGYVKNSYSAIVTTHLEMSKIFEQTIHKRRYVNEK